jgi:hypothetical protein
MWSFIVRDKTRERMFEIKASQRILGPKAEDGRMWTGFNRV